MKKPFLLSILFLSLIFQIAAQNYQAVNSGRIASFKNAEAEVKFIRIDSVFFDTDSILVPFSNMQQYSEECFTPYGSHWSGKEITITPYGTNIIKNKDGYPFYINTQAELGESFGAFILFGMQVVMATVTDHDTLTFLGVQDSVKTYTLQVYNDYNQPVNHPLNGITFKISKDHGFVQTLNFSLFPDLYNSNPLGGEMLESYDLVGFSSPVVGVQNLTWMDVHDFQPGDEIHVYYYAYLIPYFSTEIQQLIYKYLEREDFDDSVIYTVERIKSRYFHNHQGSTFEFTHDTIAETYGPDEEFDKLPGEIILDDDYGAFYYSMNTTWHQAKIWPSYVTWLFQSTDDCWNFMVVTGCLSDYTWFNGLGGPYHQCYYMGGEIERSLVYYKKGDEEWGTPLVIVGVDEQNISQNARIYPNPARQVINVQLSEAALPAKIGFYNVMGSLLKEFVLTEANQQISLQQLTPGLYFYRIANEKEALGSGKLIVE
jgi:hypothetical protein